MPSTDAIRYERERTFHDDRFAAENRQQTDKFYEVDAGATRYDALLDSIRPGQRVLEYGCGAGSAAFRLAARGADVVGIDISAVGVEAARSQATATASSARFEVMNAEALDFPAATFDVVCGSGILHHLDIERAAHEVARTLVPGGWGVFFEPLGMNPLINAYRRRTPHLRTPDEHPFVEADFELLRRVFPVVEVETFNLLALAAAPLAGRAWARRLTKVLQRADARLFSAVPQARRWGWVVVIRVQRAPADAGR